MVSLVSADDGQPSRSTCKINSLCVIANVVYAGDGGPHSHQVLDAAAPHVCWCCLRDDSIGATFRKEAHVVARALGNRHLLTSEECDDCNALLGEHESDIAAKLAAHRMFQFHRGTGRPAKYKAAGRDSKVQTIDDNGVIKVKQLDDEPRLLEVYGEGQMVVRVPYPGYRPVGTAKVLARLALVLAPCLRGSYDHLRRWVRGEVALPPQRIWTAALPDPSRPLVQQVVVFEHELDSTGIQHAVLLKFGTAFCWYALPPATGVPRSPTFPPIPGLKWTREIVQDGQFEPAGCYELHGTFNGMSSAGQCSQVSPTSCERYWPPPG